MEAKQVESLVLTISTTMPSLPSDLAISGGKMGRARCAKEQGIGQLKTESVPGSYCALSGPSWVVSKPTDSIALWNRKSR